MSNGDEAPARKLRVLHLDHTTEAGGAELALVRLANCADGWWASILLPGQLTTDLGVFDRLNDGTPLHMLGPRQKPGISSGNSIGRLFGYIRQIAGQALAIRWSPQFRRADVVHANTSRSSLYGALACLASRKKLVIHLRDHISVESLGTIGFWAFKHIVLRRANGLIGNSQSTLSTATNLLSRSTVHTAVVPSPIGISRLEDPAPSRPNRGGLRVGMIARIDPWKGQALLLEAFAMAFPDGDEQLVFAGGSLFGHEKYLEQLRDDAERRGLRERVHFLGHVDDISTVIMEMDVCVQASMRPEPLGQNVLQYLVAGRCVIAAGEGGPSEWITHGKNGMLFKPRDAEALATALSTVASDQTLLENLQREAPRTPGLLSDREIADLHGRVFEKVSCP